MDLSEDKTVGVQLRSVHEAGVTFPLFWFRGNLSTEFKTQLQSPIRLATMTLRMHVTLKNSMYTYYPQPILILKIMKRELISSDQ